MKPEQKTTEQAVKQRRTFLLGATLGGAGAVAAVVTGVTGGLAGDAINVAAAPKEKAKVKGYHETDHIRQYYETTRI